MWLDETLKKGIESLEEEKKYPGYFSVSSISNVPYISFPCLNKEQNDEICEQAKNVLRKSRSLNSYKEVAITYDISKLNKDNKRDYYYVYGDYNSVMLMDDEKTKNTILNANTENSVVVINLHNHPNNSNFSINDLLVFSNNNSIKIMAIINKEGEISFLQRVNNRDLSKIVFRNIQEYVPNLQERIDNIEKREYFISDIIPEKDLRIKIYKDSIREFIDNGVIYCPYVDQEKANKLDFSEIKEDFTMIENTANIPVYNGFLTEDDFKYIENGEDNGDYQ